MNKLEEQCYLAGYNGKPLPPWVPKKAIGLRKSYKAGKADRKEGRELMLRPGLEWVDGKIRRKTD